MAKKAANKSLTVDEVPAREVLPSVVDRMQEPALRQQVIDAWHATRFLQRAFPLWREWCEEAVRNGSADPRLPILLRVKIYQSLGALSCLNALPPTIRNHSVDEIMGYLPGEIPGFEDDAQWQFDRTYVDEALRLLKSDAVTRFEDELLLFECTLIESPSAAFGQADKKTDKRKKNAKKLPPHDVNDCIRYVREQWKFIEQGKRTTATKKQLIAEHLGNDETTAMERQLQPSRFGWLLEAGQVADK